MSGYSAYPEYKPTDCEWFSQIPVNWGIDRVKWSVDSCQNGVWGSEPEGNGDLVCIRVADFDRQSLRVSTEKLTMRSIPEKDRRGRLLVKGDLLIEKSGGGDQQLVGAVVEFDQDFSAVTSNFIARMGVNKGMIPRFLVYVHSHLYSGRVNYRSIKQTTGIQNLDGQSYLDEPTAYPPMAEQEAIARFLDYKTAQIDALIAKKEALLAKLAEKRTALISHAVTKGLDPSVPMKDSGVEWLGEIPAHWDLIKLGRKIQLQRGVDITKDEQCDGVVPVVSSGGVASYHNVAYAKGPGVLVGRKGTAGSVHFIDSDYWPHDTTLWVKEFRGNEPRYVFYKLCSMNLSSFDTGTSNPTINRNLVHPTLVSWPPLAEQKKIATYINYAITNIDNQCKKIQAAVEILQEYRSALITNAVTGKIDVRGFPIPSSTSKEVRHA